MSDNVKRTGASVIPAIDWLCRAFGFAGLLLTLIALAFAGTASAAARHTTLTWYGHAAFKIVTPQGHVLLLDPWLTNPANPHGKQDLAGLQKADLILITHGHFDHVGDSVQIAKRTGAKLVANSDLGKAMVADLGYPADQATGATLGNSGGTLTLLGGEVKVTFVPAVHGSTITVPAADGKGKEIRAGGNPNGFVVRIKNGPTFYDTGDTDVFTDMKLIPEFNPVDVMLACIGGHYTMGPVRAALAVELVKPKVVIPMHYGTFPALSGTPEAFRAALEKRHASAELRVMKVGESISF